jgi:hypothetical protein
MSLKIQGLIILAVAVAVVIRFLRVGSSDRIQRARDEEDYMEHERWLQENDLDNVCTSEEAAEWLGEMRDGK